MKWHFFSSLVLLVNVSSFLFSTIRLSHFTAHPQDETSTEEQQENKNLPLVIDCPFEINKGKSHQIEESLPLFCNNIVFAGICSFLSYFGIEYKKRFNLHQGFSAIELETKVLSRFKTATLNILNPQKPFYSLSKLSSKFFTYLQPENFNPEKDYNPQLDVSFSCCFFNDYRLSCFCSNGAALLINNSYTGLELYQSKKSTGFSEDHINYSCPRALAQKGMVALIPPETLNWFQTVFEAQTQISLLKEFIYSKILDSFDAPTIMYNLYREYKKLPHTPLNKEASLYLIFFDGEKEKPLLEAAQ